ncbi:deoxyribose-phosphate aldolase [Methylacidimicrobium cyclopophantes]|uniref:Deoxyribose-phosphate aldolase n=1 Tax=Methylacidimicrobium cyclopophantes TaxID=1041766 RepID=A0A5E6MC40_9BACT|nr:deoxyribose-phosphate aldolase [Methylacidimicrobium cyclopophantes]VVM06789.1 deoxyribose-phosphate aldolase [Methylacidimicrobium cyclopophantes]
MANVGEAPILDETGRRLASCIDHTLLRPEATSEKIARLCREALTYGFYAVCLHSVWLPLARRLLEGSGVRLCTVIDFPHGASSLRVKERAASIAVEEGADELDMVIPLGAAKEGDWECVEDHVAAVVGAAPSRPVKAILEIGALTEEEIRFACLRAAKAGAAFLKTSTGFGFGGATPEAVSLMRSTVGLEVKIKASGGIRDRESALRLIAAGAARLGTSSSIEIVQPTHR